jgi:catechol 2,3-dioxygenase-like lactoylglutathione lyase family enzyme
MDRALGGVDHAVILVRDLDRARETYRRMGFTLTPRGFHSLGSQNHCIMFGRDYLELMALPKPHPAFAYFSEFLARREGVGAIALASGDAAAARAGLLRAGVAAEAPLALSRPVQDLGEARFTLVQLPPAQTPGFRAFVCQHHTRDIVWRPEYQSHPIGAERIADIIVAADDRAPYEPVMRGMPVSFDPMAELRKRLGGLALPDASPPAVVAIRIRVPDRESAAATLRRGGFAPMRLADGSVAVGADEAHGVALVFG